MKRFRGWEPTTTFVYDGERLVSSSPDVEWDEQQQGWMLALKAYRNSRCPTCGGNLAETTKAENEDAYVHEPPLTCHRCVAFARGHEAYADQRHPQALIHLVSPHPTRRR